MSSLLLDVDLMNPSRRVGPLDYPGDFGSGRPDMSIMSFGSIDAWRDYLLTLQIESTRVPTVFCAAYHDALRLMLLGWVEPVAFKAAELQALRSLEAALRDVYFEVLFERARKAKPSRSRDKFHPGLGQYLDHMATHDALPAALHNVQQARRTSSLDSIRNRLAHGSLFETMPWGGLFESVREVMEHAFRNHPERPDPQFDAVPDSSDSLLPPYLTGCW